MTTASRKKRLDEKSDGYEKQIMPVQWGDKYTTEDTVNIERLIDWMNDKQKPRTWLASASGINRSTMTQILSGKYPSGVTKHLKRVLDTINHYEMRAKIKETPFVPTTVSRLVTTACNRARSMKSFAVVAANVGTGKTRTLFEYTANNANTYLLQADPCMSPSSLLEDLIELLGIAGPYKWTRERRMKDVIRHLEKIESPLIILDEAETVNPRTLEHLRRIRDKANVGVVLSGTAKLYGVISPERGQFEQIRSRTCFFPKPIHSITKEDCVNVLCASLCDRPEVLNDKGEFDRGVLSAFWHYSQGSMRVIVEDLIPAIRDYGLPQHKVLSADLVHAVAKEVLSFG